MGFLDTLRRLTTNQTYAVDQLWFTPADVMKMDAAQLWREQPHLRTVVTFMARNVAQLGLQSFVRVSDTDRKRDRTSKVAQLFGRPSPQTTSFELVYGLVADMALYDIGYWLLNRSTESESGFDLLRIPVPWVTSKKGDSFGYGEFKIQAPGAREAITVSAADMIVFPGWSPESARDGSSPVYALKEILAEQIQAVRYREAVWRRGGKVSSVITRPAGAKWSDAARASFKADWNAKFTGSGSEVGGSPILEDGMTLNKMDFSAREQEFIEGAKLALATVASVFHLNPTMIGQLDNANYSNVREFRKMLYGDSLGPVIAMIEDRVNTFLVPRLVSTDSYVEFNIAEKLQGNFEEQTTAMQSAVGRPWMTPNEARAKQNMPALEGDADELATPLNVLVGGQASPRDSAPPKSLPAALGGKLVLLKSRAPETFETKYAQTLTTFFKRQRASVVGKLGGKAAGDWWDAERWDGELSDDLYKLAVLTATEVGRETTKELGFDADDYDVDRTLAFLKATSETSAKNINAQTAARIEEALDDAEDDEDPQTAAGPVFDEAEGSRAVALGVAAVTTMSGFATVEAGQQVGASTKTWVTGANPRSAHAAMNGETVALSDNFSNGLAWPGDSAGDADDLAGCNCDLEINVG